MSSRLWWKSPPNNPRKSLPSPTSACRGERASAIPLKHGGGDVWNGDVWNGDVWDRAKEGKGGRRRKGEGREKKIAHIDVQAQKATNLRVHICSTEVSDMSEREGGREGGKAD